MSYEYCQRCKTFDGWIKPPYGSRRRATRCLDHPDTFYVCDICSVRVRMEFYRGYRAKENSSRPSVGPEWEYLKTGRTKRNHPDTPDPNNLDRPTDVSVHVCPDCAEAYRKALLVVLDTVSEQRAGLRAGVFLGTPPAPAPGHDSRTSR